MVFLCVCIVYLPQMSCIYLRDFCDYLVLIFLSGCGLVRGDSSWLHTNRAYLQQRFSPANRFIGMTVATRARPFSRCTMFTWWCVCPNVVAFIWTVVAFIPPYTCLHLHFHVPIKIPVTLSEHCLFYISSDFFVLFLRNILARSENI